jgi:hypothetical protein
MNELDKKNPFSVPDGYFEGFDKKLAQRIDSIDLKNGFKTPPNYFQKVENQILDQIDYPKTVSFSSYLWKVAAVAAVMALFIFNENTAIDKNELAEFFIEDYLTSKSTYEIADHTDYQFEMENFIDSYESIALDDALDIVLYGESPTNLNLFDDE